MKVTPFVPGEKVYWFKSTRVRSYEKIPAVFTAYGTTSDKICYVEYKDKKTGEKRKGRAFVETVERMGVV